MATNILGLMDYVQQQGELGRKQGQQQSFNRLAGQAYTAPAEQQSALVGQAVGIDPAAGVALGNTLASRNQAQETDHLKKIGGAARYMAQAIQSKNPAQIDGAYQAVRPYLAELGQSIGKVPPEHWDPSMEPGVFQIIAQTGGAPDVRGVVVAPGSVLANPSNGESMFRNPAALQYHDVPMGEGKAAGAFDPATGTVRPAVGGGQPTVDPMQSFIDQANAAIKMGAPQAQVEAWLQQQAQGAGLNPQPAGQATPASSQLPGAQPPMSSAPAQFGVGTPKPATSNLPSGYRMAADGRSLEAIPGGPADKTGAGSVTLGDTTKTGNDFLATIADPSVQEQIKAIAEGRMPLPRVSRPSKAGEISPQTIQQAVAQYDPTYDQADPSSRIRARTTFTTGAEAKQLRQLNTLIGHLGGLVDSVDKLNNSGSTDFNAIANNLATRAGSTKATNFDAAALPAVMEFATILKGGVPDQQEIRYYKDQLSSSHTHEQLMGTIGTMAAQVQSRIAALQEQAHQALGPFADKITIMSPAGEAALDKLRERGLIGKFDVAPSGATAPAPAAPAAGGDFSHLWGG